MDFMESIAYLVLVMLSLLKVTSTFNLDYQYPIVFEDPTAHPKRETYFGYSVLLYSTRPNKAWIMVGAPRANSTFRAQKNIKEPGVVYKCRFEPNMKCEELLLDETDISSKLKFLPVSSERLLVEAESHFDVKTLAGTREKLLSNCNNEHGNDRYRDSSVRLWDLKDGAWIGAAMDVQPGPGGRVTMCGPRWINQGYKEEHNDYYQLGVCYWMNAEEDSNAAKLIPLAVNGRMLKQISDRNSIYDLGDGEAGFAVHMPLTKGQEEGSELLLGAPGILNWRGGTILYEDDSHLPSGGFNKRSADYAAFSNYYVPPQKPSSRNHLKEFDYFGYAVNSGYFYDEKELWYATSAPRSNLVSGKVIIYKVVKKMFRGHGEIMVGDNYQVMGIQCGEYFGASIAAGKVNGDEYEDLIVGAPLYASEGIARSDSGFAVEEGRISVFFGSGTKQMKEVQIFGKVKGARFGSAVAYLNDPNSNGPGEIAVGAPYENEGRGAVYIFSGSKDSIISKPVQKLLALDTYPLLRGFGSSISPHPADIDDNGCYDVAVGAYKSGHAVVFRGRPVLKWKTQLPQSKSRIPRNATHFTMFGACVTYYGNNVPNNQTVWRILDLDPTYKRCYKNNQLTLGEELHLFRGIQYCEDIFINITDARTKNIIEPIEIRMKYQLHEELASNRPPETIHPVVIKADGKKVTEDKFCKTCPISKDSTDSQLYFPFEVGCGVDEICHSDLVIDGKLPQLNTGEFVIGSSKTLKLSIHVSNMGEPAYRTQVFIVLGSPGKIARIPPECNEIPNLSFMDTNSGNSSEVSGNAARDENAIFNNDMAQEDTNTNVGMNSSFIYLRCDLDNPLPTNSTRVELVEIDMKNVHASAEMYLFSYVTTISNETSPENNVWYRNIPFTYKADIEIIGRAGRDDLFTYFKENKNESESRFRFFHIYEVQKYGFSPVEKINIILQIPISIEAKGSNDQINFLRLISTEGSQSGQSFPCTILDEVAADQPDGNDDLNSKHHKKWNGGREFTLISNYSTTQVPSNRTLYLNCSSLPKKDEHTVKCISVSCATGPFLNSLTLAKVLLEMEIDVSSLEKIMGLRDIILLETQGFVEIVEPATLIQPKIERADISWASTRFIGDIPKKHVESWVLALAIGGGIMLLLFFAMAMHKAGFFERKKKEELKSLKRKTLAEYATHANEEQELEIEQAFEE